MIMFRIRILKLWEKLMWKLGIMISRQERGTSANTSPYIAPNNASSVNILSTVLGFAMYKYAVYYTLPVLPSQLK